MSEHNDIYRILESLDAAQKSVKQLPALFKPAQTSPQLDGAYPGKNATRGYMVGEGDESVNPMVQAVHRRIAFTRPEWITKYGMDAIDYAIDDIVGDDWDGEEIGSSDVSHYIHMIGEYLRDRVGSREEMADRKPFAEGNPEEEKEPDDDESGFVGSRDWESDDDEWDTTQSEYRFLQSKKKKKKVKESLQAGEYHPATVTLDDGTTHKVKIRSVPWQAVVNALAAGYPDADPADSLAPVMKKYGAEFDDLDRLAQQNGYSNVYAVLGDFDQEQGLLEDRDTATEDVLSSIKKKLGDYLQDVATAIKKDPDLVDKIPQAVDQISAVKTITTDDGHEIKIHGNEDDGFRISIKNKDAKTTFRDLDEATMAVEMYCARRRQQMENADYIEEKR